MKVLLCHNHYAQPGGEDRVFIDEGRLLEARGCRVVRFERYSRDAECMPRWEVARRLWWSAESYEQLRALIQQKRPDVVHCTNLFPLISPAAYDAARDEGVPIVQSLHNFRSLCPNGLLMREGSVCHACLKKRIPWPSVVHGCYRQDRLSTAVLAGALSWHGRRRAQRDPVAVYVALSQFSRAKFIEGGFSPEKVVVKPNFVAPDPGPGPGFGGYAVFVGRLSSEKGLDVLMNAWSRLPLALELKVVGDGPLASMVSRAAGSDPRIQWLGRRSNGEIMQLLGVAETLILPSVCYENCPKVILEAYSRGTPVIASRLGAMAEYVDHGRTGFTFEPSRAESLAGAVQRLMADQGELAQLRQQARAEYEQRFTADRNFQMLMEIYARAMRRPVDKILPSFNRCSKPAPLDPAAADAPHEACVG